MIKLAAELEGHDSMRRDNNCKSNELGMSRHTF